MDEAGGLMVLRYGNGAVTFEVRVPVAPFDPHTYLYTASSNPPGEAGIATTFLAFGLFWSRYFEPGWTLQLASLWFQVPGADATPTEGLPTVSAVTGGGVPAASEPPIRRGFSVRSALGHRQYLVLEHIATRDMGRARMCTASSGGFDARDRALVGYLCSPATGVRCWDGLPFPPVARVYERFMRPDELAAARVGSGGTGETPSAAALPTDAGQGAITYYSVNPGWKSRQIGSLGQTLAVQSEGQRLLPVWKPCCGEDTLTDIPPIVTGSGGGSGGPGVDYTPLRCGAARAMAAGLDQVYALISVKLDQGITQAVQWGLPLLVDVVEEALSGGLATPILVAEQPILFGIARFLAKHINISAFPQLSDTQKAGVLEAAYKALPGGTNTFDITQEILSMWAANIGKSTVFATQQSTLLQKLIPSATLASWKYIANTGSQQPSSDCKELLNDYGLSLQGGAVIGTAGKSISGGVLFGVSGLSLSGGGNLLGHSALSMSGGATRL